MKIYIVEDLAHNSYNKFIATSNIEEAEEILQKERKETYGDVVYGSIWENGYEIKSDLTSFTHPLKEELSMGNITGILKADGTVEKI